MSNLTFRDVLLEELKLIRRRQSHRGDRNGQAAGAPGPGADPGGQAAGVPGPNAAGADDPRGDAAYWQAHDMALSGLALSGGGIRSATFNLGMLQALAKRGLLRKFDYLSTVSGGGYIGSWLAAWIQREGGMENVERQLRPSRVDNAAALRSGLGPGEVREQEPEPIAHLRAFSNYLTPRLGWLSWDSWVLGAIYLRNFLLNQLILLPFVMMVLMGARLVLALFYEREWPIRPGVHVGAAVVLLFAAQLVAEHAIWVLRERQTGRLTGWSRFVLDPWGIRLVIFVPLVVASVLVAGLFISGRLAPDVALLPAMVGIYALAQFVATQFITLVGDRTSGSFREAARWMVSSLAAGATGGALLWSINWLLHTSVAESKYGVALGVLIAPPSVLAVFVLVNFIQTGLLGGVLGEDMREWWASLSAGVMRCMATWTVLFAVALFGGWVLLRVGPWIRALLGVTWLGSAINGVMAGRGPARVPGVGITWRDVAAQLAPYVVIIGLLSFVSLLAAVVLNQPSPWVGHVAWDQYWAGMAGARKLWIGAGVVFCFLLTVVMSLTVGINVFSLHAMYRNRLVRCYLGASRPKPPAAGFPNRGVPTNACPPDRSPNPVTGFDPTDDLDLTELGIGATGKNLQAYWGPLLILNTALNLVLGEELAWQERMADSFFFTPTHCGSRSTGYRPLTGQDGVTLGTIVTVSGAAVSPNMGYHTWRAVAALLTVFNVRLGRWFSNPGVAGARPSEPPKALAFLLNEMLGLTNARSDYVYLSDGGHFDNLGVYELVRRRCRYVLACDAAADPDLEFADLAGLIRKCRTDLGIRISIDLTALRLRNKKKFAASHNLTARWLSSDAVRVQGDERYSMAHVAVGGIHYEDVDPDAATGILVYVKASLTGDEPADVLQYAEAHRSFPHQTTTDQWFDESQFESYRALGHHIGRTILDGI